MTDVIVDVAKLKDIPTKNMCDSINECIGEYLDGCFKSYKEYMSRCKIWVCMNIGPILCVIIMSSLICILTFLWIKSTTAGPSFPCSAYSNLSLANTISIQCLQYIWSLNKCALPSVFPPVGYQGWWNQSPQGSVSVKCDSVNSGTSCGAGSYQTIYTYMQFCNAYYTG